MNDINDLLRNFVTTVGENYMHTEYAIKNIHASALDSISNRARYEEIYGRCDIPICSHRHSFDDWFDRKFFWMGPIISQISNYEQFSEYSCNLLRQQHVVFLYESYLKFTGYKKIKYWPHLVKKQKLNHRNFIEKLRILRNDIAHRTGQAIVSADCYKTNHDRIMALCFAHAINYAKLMKINIDGYSKHPYGKVLIQAVDSEQIVKCNNHRVSVSDFTSENGLEIRSFRNVLPDGN